ncbi:neurogenic protein big brain [Culicoides brevitarsis]|uniref:neurogenic protein big brain n=1 Tax=Culicoides brevitarsis TaxID=469753 RepID=UPI00307BF812
MADESLHTTLANVQNIDYHIVTLLEKLESMRKEAPIPKKGMKKFNMHQELRTLEFWRSIISECLSSFFYVFIVCGAAAGAGIGASISSVLLATALASGFAIAALTQCFFHVSGANINPAITLALAVTRNISPIRAALYITAQCGGGIAGAALLYSVTVPGYQGNLQAAVTHTASLAAWERFGVELILTFIIVLTYFVSTTPKNKLFGYPSLVIGAAYSACSFVSMPYLNPARSLGPSFVLNKWENHWVYWVGPMLGGVISGVLYEYVFNPNRHNKKGRDADQESSSMSDDDMNYDLELEKPKYHAGSQYNTYRSTTATTLAPQPFCEPIYGGTRSMYCRSPPLTRANLHRSQSVYAKSNGAINRESARSGQLVPAQSLYPLRLSTTQQPPQSAHAQNQNVQNQLQHRSESIYGIRSSFRQQSTTQHGQQQQHIEVRQEQRGMERTQIQHHQDGGHAFQPIYGSRSNPTPTEQLKYEPRDDSKYRQQQQRPDSVYGTSSQRRVQSAQSDDSSYGSYQGSSLTPPNRSTSISNYAPQPLPTYGAAPSMQQQMSSSCSDRPSSKNSANGPPQQRIDQYATSTKQSQISTNPNGGTQQMHQQQMQQHSVYGMHPVRQN